MLTESMYMIIFYWIILFKIMNDKNKQKIKIITIIYVVIYHGTD